MRQLLGKSRFPSRDVTEEVYLSEHIYCQTCQITVPMGIEVVTVRNERNFKKVVKHAGTAAHTVPNMRQRRWDETKWWVSPKGSNTPPRFVCLLRINGGQTNRGYFRILGWVGGLSLEGFICESNA